MNRLVVIGVEGLFDVIQDVFRGPGDGDVADPCWRCCMLVMAAFKGVLMQCPIAELGCTGVGKFTGLKRMGEIKTTLAKEFEEAEAQSTISLIPEDSIATDSTPIDSTSQRTDEKSVTLDANKSIEIKLAMAKGNKVNFTWSTDAGQVFYDLHADSKEVNYHIYEKGTDSTKTGTLEAAFDGNHGWYWKNRAQDPITITLTTTGIYEDIKIMH